MAQKLYEGLPIGERGPVGLITYMRTDSVRVSAEAQAWAGHTSTRPIRPALRPDPRPCVQEQEAKPRTPTRRSGRPRSSSRPRPSSPTSRKRSSPLHADLEPVHGLPDEPGRGRGDRIRDPRPTSTCSRPRARSSSSTASWPCTRTWRTETRTASPRPRRGETLSSCRASRAKQNFTQPPPRYTEGTLVKELEAKGIGRPSTYAPIISTLQNRIYVVKEKGKFVPTDLGMFVTDFLVAQFPRPHGGQVHRRDGGGARQDRRGREWSGSSSLREYLRQAGQGPEGGRRSRASRPPASRSTRTAPSAASRWSSRAAGSAGSRPARAIPNANSRRAWSRRRSTPLEEKCPDCGAHLVQRRGRFGLFIACSNYPNCKYIKKKATEKWTRASPARTAAAGRSSSAKTKRGKFFYGCGRFPKCRFATWDEPLKQPCPKCGKPFILREEHEKGGTFLPLPGRELRLAGSRGRRGQ